MLTLVYAQFCESRKTSSVKRQFTWNFDKEYESEYDISIQFYYIRTSISGVAINGIWFRGLCYFPY